MFGRALRPLLVALALLAPGLARAQLPPAYGLVINNTPVQGGTSGQCLYISTGILSSQACGAGTAATIDAGGATSISNGTPAGILFDSAGKVATSTSPALGTPTATSLAIGAGSAITSSGAGGALGSNAFTSTAFAPAASPTFSGTVTMPDASVWTSTGVANVVSETIAGGTLASGATAFTSTTVMPTSPSGITIANQLNSTGAGNASQITEVLGITYSGGYTGSSSNFGIALVNLNAGTGSTLIPTANSNTAIANFGMSSGAAGATAGLNVGLAGKAQSGAINVGLLGLSQSTTNSATNIGVVGSGINGGSSPVQIGGFFSLNQTAVPSVSAGVIADNGSQANPIALWRAAGATVASVNATGGLTATLTNVATTSAVCFNTGTLLLTYDGTLGTCNTSDERLKTFDHDPLDGSLEKLISLTHDEHFGRFHWNDNQFGTGEKIGIGAQTVAKYFPELTATGSDGNMSMAYDKLSVPLIKALAELKADNDNLRACQSDWKCRIFGWRG